MKNLNFLPRILPGLFLPGLLALAGCSQDETAGVPAGDGPYAISFYTQGASGGLRATSTPTSYISGFVVNAHQSMKPSDWGTDADYLLRGTTVYRGEGGGSNWSYSPVSYFPVSETPGTDYVEFFAYSPAGSDRMSPKLGQAITPDQTIGYKVPPPSGTNNGATTQEDLLVAYQKVDAGDYEKPVKLQFRHALSRVLVAAKSSLPSSNITITGLTLKNLKSEGTLNLKGNTSTGLDASDGIPVSTSTSGEQVNWVYDPPAPAGTGNYVTLWTTTAPEDYSYVLPASGVTVGATSQLVTTVEQGMFVLPQTTEGDPSHPAQPTDFGLEVAYTLDGKASTPAFIRFDDINGIPFTSVTFEIGRQYVLNLNFGGTGGGVQVGAAITFGDIDADAYPAPPIPVSGKWATSNIYFQPNLGTPEIGTLTFSVANQSESGYQGLFFKWGSLIGIAAGASGDPFDANTYLYIPDVTTGTYYKVEMGVVNTSYTQPIYPAMEAAVLAFANAQGDFSNGGATDWDKIPYADAGIFGGTLSTGRNDNRLTAQSGTILYNTYRGDVCKFLSSRSASGLTDSWIMPTSAMLPGSGVSSSLPYIIGGHVWDLVPNSIWDATENFSSDDLDGTGMSPDKSVILTSGGALVFQLSPSGERHTATGYEISGRGVVALNYTASLSVSDKPYSFGGALQGGTSAVKIETEDDITYAAHPIRCVRE
ncbi:hypothetical protein AGMMS49574_29060 [Bacteroidia bacterium]|nr:hypothetical protein AGMMS49574_29060 [Bacteroidia bacterium]